jgi:hypothetical protein
MPTIRRGFQHLNEGNDLWARDPKWTHQERHEFSEIVIRGNERVTLLPAVRADARFVRAAYRRDVRCTLGGYYIAGAQGIFRLSLILI